MLSQMALTLSLAFGTSQVFAADKRPNILFIYTDDHSHRTVGCYDEAFPWVKTPTIDRLAKEGVRFEYAYIGTWCMPSRATLLTGHHQFGVESMRMEGDYPGSAYDPEKCPFWPRVFRKNGYQTAHIGKWHTGVDTGYGRDWDFQIVWNRPRFTKNHQAYYYDQPVTFQGGETKKLDGYSTDRYTDWAIEYLKGEGRDENKPWYLWMCYGAVHSPFTPADRHMDEYPDITVPQPKDVFPPRAGKPAWQNRVNMFSKRSDGVAVWKGRTLTSWVRQYHQGVVAIDENINRLLKALEETGQRDNTLIIFTSDQGHAWGQHGFRQKVAPYDATIRSPMIVSFPGKIPGGKVCPHPVGGVDIVPTIFSWAGIEMPWKMHGHDLTPLLMDPTGNWEHTMLLTATGRKYGSDTHKIPTGDDVFHSNCPWYVMIRQGKYKYIRPMIDDIEELYDMKADPNELNNLAVKPEYQSTLKKLRAEALKELRRTKAGFVDNLPPVAKAF